jgi:putative FmdB family regulatory protein
MPLYDFTCGSCGRVFEVLVRPGEETPVCPDCGSQQLERMLSNFAVSSETTRGTALRDGRKRAARQQRDAAIAAREHEIEHHH